jgi:hypothetical protein
MMSTRDVGGLLCELKAFDHTEGLFWDETRIQQLTRDLEEARKTIEKLNGKINTLAQTMTDLHKKQPDERLRDLQRKLHEPCKRAQVFVPLTKSGNYKGKGVDPLMLLVVNFDVKMSSFMRSMYDGVLPENMTLQQLLADLRAIRTSQSTYMFYHDPDFSHYMKELVEIDTILVDFIERMPK